MEGINASLTTFGDLEMLSAGQYWAVLLGNARMT
jgi:hypothetical protein